MSTGSAVPPQSLTARPSYTTPRNMLLSTKVEAVIRADHPALPHRPNLQITTGLSSASFSRCRNTMSTESVRTVWKNADAVCFDVDSTVIQEEAIDELAKFCNKGEEVQKLTLQAMSGKMTFNESLKTRLNIIRPSMSQIRDFVQKRPPTLTRGIKKLIECLHQRGTSVYLISGGFRGLIGPVALELNIPLENIYANKLKFYLNGDYAGFDENEPTCQSGGKGKVIESLKSKFGYTNLVMVGDGMTDYESCPPADAFIGFGGNVTRNEVKSRAKWFVTDFQELVDAL